MSQPAIRVENLSKEYVIGATQRRTDTFYDVLGSALKAPFRRFKKLSGQVSAEERLWALKDVSFEVQPGEVVGIIGRNGAGKSTLLKVLSRITEPTRGRVAIRGRVASLLEVGTGFHPELTGRENIYLNGAILGMTRQEISRKFDDIVAFAEIEKFLDTPVKRYSSGMYVRLAFAVAAHLEPEILVVDEVLAVGDAQFQKKCLGKMGDVANEGRTVFLVSHNMTAIEALCSRAVLFGQGELIQNGPSKQVVRHYLSEGIMSGNSRVWSNPQTAPGNEYMVVRAARAYPTTQGYDKPIYVTTNITIEVEYEVKKGGFRLQPNIWLKNEDDIVVFSSGATVHTEKTWHGKMFPKGRYRSQCFVPGQLLNSGQYSIRVFFGKDERWIIANLDNLISINVIEDPEIRGAYLDKTAGVVRPTLKWATEVIADPI